MARPLLAITCLFALAGLSACGSSHSASSASTGAQPASAPPPQSRPRALPRSTGLAGNGTFSQAATICRGFIDKANAALHLGIKAFNPRLAPGLYGELEGLSRRIQFLRAPADRRAGVARWANDLDRAAITSNRFGALDASTPAGRAQVASVRDRLALDIARSNADAALLGLRSCQIKLNGQGA